VNHSAALESARALHAAGHWREAQIAYRRIIEREPRNVAALHLLASLLSETGQLEAAAQTMEKAVRCQPSNADAHANLGALLHALQRFAQAEPVLRHAVALDPRHAHAHNVLGMVLGDLGRTGDALASFRRAIDLEPALAHAHYNLGVALAHTGDAAAAVHSYRRALQLDPNVASLHCDLADVLFVLGRSDEAEASYRTALALEPAFVPAHVGLAHVSRHRGQAASAEEGYRRALALNPSAAGIYMHLGLALFDQHRPEEAEQSFRQALRLEPRMPEAHGHFADTLKLLGRLDEAERSFRQALEINPGYAAMRSDLLLLLNYIPGRGAEEIYAEHEEFGRRVAALREMRPPATERNPDRQLRIGYVSGDLRQHAVAHFIEPVLERHHRDDVEVTCYYSNPTYDATTMRLKGHADRWRDVAGMSDEALTHLIREDAIDLLVDLSGHTGRQRLLAFARKPAPVQATWLGYLNTTGMEAMDWRITDGVATPAGLLDRLHSEALLRLPDSQWCYRAAQPSPDVSPPPVLTNGFCTFASFSSAAKINAEVIRTWSRLLAAVPRARLRVMVNGPLPTDYAQRFAREGISPDRLQLRPGGYFDEYLAAHAEVDIMLDSFPYTGGTTTCHCLWMGVPIVTMVGTTATSRGGASLLSAVGLQEFVAQNPDEYVAIAAALAQDAQRLRSLRASLRERMRSSPLMDAERFTRNLEQAYRRMWREWCSNGASRHA